jgi:hypothetical protein
MANPEHVEVVKQGAQAIRKWREHNSQDDELDLNGADLSESKLIGADLERADLIHANLSGASLAHANLSGADLSNANLQGAVLFAVDLSWADGNDADFSKADLRLAVLRGTRITGARFHEATIRGTVFGEMDLSRAKELETIQHQGPSILGVDSIYRSKGKIPEAFLRGCGVPDFLITYLSTLVGTQEFYSCFISYSHKDEDFATRLYSRMRDEHLRVWYAPEEMKGGKKLQEQIEQAIQVHDKLLLVLSEASMNSEWVATEIYHARQREVKEKRRVLFPIRLVPFEMIRQWQCFDADSGKDMAREIREYFIPEFSNWKDHDSFEAAFKRLLDDLKATS